MSKYDCSKALDYAHEFRRMCDSYGFCSEGCPMNDECECGDANAITSAKIDKLQKWSDEHPEPSKIKKRELDFMAMFETVGNKRILRDVYGNLYFEVFDEFIKLQDAWFDCIGLGESMTFEELLKLEVEEDE